MPADIVLFKTLRLAVFEVVVSAAENTLIHAIKVEVEVGRMSRLKGAPLARTFGSRVAVVHASRYFWVLCHRSDTHEDPLENAQAQLAGRPAASTLSVLGVVGSSSVPRQGCLQGSVIFIDQITLFRSDNPLLSQPI